MNGWVINLSSQTLSSPQTSILARCLNFSPVPQRVPISQIVAVVEKGLKSIPPESAQAIRHKVVGILGKAKPPPSNISMAESQALKVLRNNADIVILPADKGRATVVLDKHDYDDKLTGLLSHVSTYNVLGKDPTNRYNAR